jgi:oligoribonuclease (3'-5' exoribonuclease)
MTAAEVVPDPLLLWFDLEATGRHEEADLPPSGVEWGHMITTHDLRQLTPLRQRLVALAPRLTLRERAQSWRAQRRTSFRRDLSWPADLIDDEKVHVMHRDSGLMDDWQTSSELTTDVQVLDALVAQDLVRARSMLDHPVRDVHLAGAGVAQFDSRLLPVLGSRITTWCHYRTADTSVASFVGRVRTVPVENAVEYLDVDLQPGVLTDSATTSRHRVVADIRSAYATAVMLQSAGRHATRPLQ